MDDKFKDWIPEGEDAGSLGGGSGYQDFVPAPEPKPQTVEVVEQPVVEPVIEQPVVPPLEGGNQ